MNIFIDESGSFIVPDIKKYRNKWSVSCVAALVLPEEHTKQIFDESESVNDFETPAVRI